MFEIKDIFYHEIGKDFMNKKYLISLVRNELKRNGRFIRIRQYKIILPP